MKITFLCNAGLAIETDENVLLVDLPNDPVEPFYVLPEGIWRDICAGKAFCNKVCGFYFTHDHGDHLSKARLLEYPRQVPVFIPGENDKNGCIHIGSFQIEYQSVPHAPIEDPPAHVVSLIYAGGNRIYLAADATLDASAHDAFLRGRTADIGIWNPMYLSRPETRVLMKRAAVRNFIYHMPLKPDEYGLWKKCERNLERYAEELDGVTVIDRYPTELNI